jgi:UDP-N-acetylenolpyruvoylglucosamine reductase
VDRDETVGDDDDAATVVADSNREASLVTRGDPRGSNRFVSVPDGSSSLHGSAFEEKATDDVFGEDAGRSRPSRRVLIPNASLSKYCTLGVGGSARIVAEVFTVEQLVSTLRGCARAGLASVVIGKGSNVLFDDRGFDGVVVVNRIDFCERVDAVGARVDAEFDVAADAAADGEPFGYFRVGSGSAFNQLGARFSRESWGGLEFAMGVPGTAGGAVFMNAGADGRDTAGVVHALEIVSPDGTETRTVRVGEREPCEIPRTWFAYRRSPFMEPDHEDAETDQAETDHAKADHAKADQEAYVGWIVGSVTFRLTRDPRASARAREFARRRGATQPRAERSVGCVFRNPPVRCTGDGDDVGSMRSAGSIIDSIGLKGFRVGTASVSETHANYLVLERDALGTGRTVSSGGADFEALIREVKRAVLEKTGIELKEEVVRIPKSSGETRPRSVPPRAPRVASDPDPDPGERNQKGPR